ncbi:MAG: PKD domain-containing protein [Crocinitomicaceae bacterium]|nr:PKD domain-containing protein [Crocinitomicaceae bacterium]
MLISKSIRNIVLKSLLVFFNWLFFGTSANAATVEPIKILFIGNSYTHMNEMPSILQKIVDKAGKNAIIERNTQSGASFKVHSERSDMYSAIKSRNWDYIVLQGFSRELSYRPEYIDSATVPFVNQITDSIYQNNPCTNILFYMTWGYEGGYLDREEVNTYEKMADSIERGYRYLSDIYDVPVVPVGMVWKAVKEKSNIDLYAPDRAHPSKNGSYLIASTFYNAIFNESNEGVFTSTIDSKNAEIIKKEAKEIVETSRHKYKLDKNKLTLSPQVSEEGKYILDFKSYFPNALDLQWKFDDGKKSKDSTGIHIYRKPGRYIVRLEVEEECGTRYLERAVVFKKPSRPKRVKKRNPKYNVNNKKKV